MEGDAEQAESTKTPEKLEGKNIMRSPFADTTEIEGIPNIAFIADTHLMLGQSSQRGFEGMAKSKAATVLSKVKPFRDRTRKIDTMATFAMRQAGKEIESEVEKNKKTLVGNLGDIVDATEVGQALLSYKRIEQFHKNIFKGSNGKMSGVMLLDGNHNAFAGVEPGVDYRNIKKRDGPLKTEDFADMVEGIKNGKTFEDLNRDWQETSAKSRKERIETQQKEKQEGVHPLETQVEKSHERAAIHPAQKWYIEKLAFGSQTGRFTERDENNNVRTQVAFLNSELFRKAPGFRPEDLQEAFREMELDENHPLAEDMMSMLKGERKRQEEVLRNVVEDTQKGAKTVVYTHNANETQRQLIEQVVQNKEMSTEEASEYVQENIQIYGGHLHLAEKDIPLPGLRPKPGTTTIRGITRSFLGPLSQPPITSPTDIIKGIKEVYPKGYDPEMLVGKADDPKRSEIVGIAEAFEKRIGAIKDPEPQKEPRPIEATGD